MKATTLSLLSVLIVIQVAVLGIMIHGKEHVLRAGEQLRFKTRPIDPADPFQGRYVALGFEHNFIPPPKGEPRDLQHHEPIFALLESGDDGFARFTGWSRERPETGVYIKTRYLGPHSFWDPAKSNLVSRGMNIALPFDRYYMDEAKAPRAEAAVRDATRSTNCWAEVRILRGKAVIEDVVACGQSLRTIAAEAPPPR